MYYVGYAVTTLPNEIRELQCSRGGREKEAEQDGKEEEERGRWKLFVSTMDYIRAEGDFHKEIYS